MDKHEAAIFLGNHQPMSFDDHLDQATLDALGDVINYYRINPDPQKAEQLMGLTGRGDASGWFEDLARLLVDVYPRQVVLPLIEEAIHGEDEGRALWAAYITWEIDCHESLEICRRCFIVASESVREILAEAIVKCASEFDIPWVNQLLENEESSGVKDLLNEAIEAIAHRN